MEPPAATAQETKPRRIRPVLKKWNCLDNRPCSSGSTATAVVIETLPAEADEQGVESLHDPFSSHFWKLRTVELCCGSARFSLHLLQAGASVIAIDKLLNPHTACVPVLAIDLSTDKGQSIVMLMLMSGKINFVHASPPCGTASRAREKRIGFSLLSRGASDPKPLRSESFPKGLPHLRGLDALRVVLANRIYNFLAMFFTACLKKEVPWSCENPVNSYLWLMPSWVQLLSDDRVKGYEYDACCLGGKRKKRSVWWSSLPEFQGLVSFCDDSHPHLSWAPYQENGQWKFPSAQEAEYPPELCKSDRVRVCSLAALFR